jgi:hypothetical protein
MENWLKTVTEPVTYCILVASYQNACRLFPGHIAIWPPNFALFILSFGDNRTWQHVSGTLIRE